jgi:formiminotetrahydrofolate cyclodeaminase
VELSSFLERLAEGTPTPGSGAAAAVAGAAAAALVAMACRVTARRAPSDALAAATERADALRRRMLDLAGEDARAYEAVVAARRAAASPGAAAPDAAMRRATLVPLELARASGEVLALAAARADDLRDVVLGELAVAGELARAALASAVLTVRLDEREVGDPGFTAETSRALAAIEADARAAGDRLAARLAARPGWPAS